MPFGQIEALEHDGVSLAFERIEGAGPTFVWLGGFKSDMSGTKAQTLANWAHESGQAFVRFDYSGHGKSGGVFESGTISNWLHDTLRIIDRLTEGPLVLVGSSMGGWLALLAARARPERVAALLLIAPAIDFTERLMWDRLAPAQQFEVLSTGRLELPSQYAPEPTLITRELVEDGRKHLMMGRPIEFSGPVMILQGGMDPDVPPEHAHAVAELLTGAELNMQVIFDGDHRLSRPEDVAILVEAANGLRQRLAR